MQQLASYFELATIITDWLNLVSNVKPVQKIGLRTQNSFGRNRHMLSAMTSAAVAVPAVLVGSSQ